MLQDFVTFQVICKRAGIEEGEVALYVRHHVGDMARLNRRKTIEAARIYDEKARTCPVCGLKMTIQPINDDDSRMVDDHSKSWWICPDINCECEPIVSDLYPHEILIDMGVPVHKPKHPQAASRKRMRSAAKQRGCGQRRRG
jgi:hypothetical protein